MAERDPDPPSDGHPPLSPASPASPSSPASQVPPETPELSPAPSSDAARVEEDAHIEEAAQSEDDSAREEGAHADDPALRLAESFVGPIGRVGDPAELASFAEFIHPSSRARSAAIVDLVPPASASPPGLGWERRAEIGIVPGMWRTFVDVLCAPRATAATMRTGDGVGEPLAFALLSGTLAALLSWTVVGLVLGYELGEIGRDSSPEARHTAQSLAWGTALLLAALTPLGLAVFLVGSAIVLHLSSVLAGAARRGFEATFRVIAYATGAVAPLAALPPCGLPIAVAWWLVCIVGGLAGAHRISLTRAAVVVGIPMGALLVAGLGLLLMLSAFVILAASAA